MLQCKDTQYLCEKICRMDESGIFYRVEICFDLSFLSFCSCGTGAHSGHYLAFSDTDIVDERTRGRTDVAA